MPGDAHNRFVFLSFRFTVMEAYLSGLLERSRAKQRKARDRYRRAGWPFGATDEAQVIWLAYGQVTTQN